MTNPNDILGILNSRDKRLEGQTYKLNGGVAPFAMDVAFPEEMDIDTSRMSVWLPFADGTRRDGVGDLLEVTGIRLERHRNNPVCLFDHGKGQGEFDKWPIALAEDRDTKAYTVEIDATNRTARCNAFFYQGTGIKGAEREKEERFAIFCEQLYHLIAERFIRAGSIGYQVIKGLPLQPDYERGVPQGLHLLETLMLEASAVIMPANMDTVRKGWDVAREILCLNGVCGKPLSPVLVKSLQSQAPAKKAMMLVHDKDCKCGGTCEKCKSTPVPLAKLPDTKIPPSRWKPGLGAIKELRLQYGSKSKDKKGRKGPTPPKVEGNSYFGSCDRDDQGHCLPSGESGQEKPGGNNPPQKEVTKNRDELLALAQYEIGAAML